MKVLNLEDNAFKHFEIKKALQSLGVARTDWARNLEDGLKMAGEEKYDLYITDMWYPLTPGGRDNRSGEVFIEKIREKRDPAPILLCSNQDYSYPEILGTLYYSDRSDWELELGRYIRSLK